MYCMWWIVFLFLFVEKQSITFPRRLGVCFVCCVCFVCVFKNIIKI